MSLNKVQDLSSLWEEIEPSGAVLRLLIDHPDQVKFLETFEKSRTHPRQWSVFIKVDCGSKCAVSLSRCGAAIHEALYIDAPG